MPDEKMTPTADNLLKGATCTEILEAADKATGLPWKHAIDFVYSDSGRFEFTVADCTRVNNAAFIVLACNNAVALATEVLALRAENERLRAITAEIETSDTHTKNQKAIIGIQKMLMEDQAAELADLRLIAEAAEEVFDKSTIEDFDPANKLMNALDKRRTRTEKT